MKILLLGNSQVSAFNQANLRRINRGVESEDCKIVVRPIGSGLELLGEFFALEAGVLRTKSEYYPSLQFSGDDRSFDAIGIAAPLYTLGISGSNDWSRFRPSGFEGPGRPVSRAIIRSMAMRQQKHVLSFIDALQEIGKKVFVLEAARLFMHHDSIKASGFDVVSCVDRIYREAIIENLNARSVPIVYVDARHLTELGFMQPEYRNETESDQNHSSVAFAELMFDEVISAAKTICS